MSGPIVLGEDPIEITASIGVAYADGSTDTTASLLHKADLAMYESKRHGKGRVWLFRPDVASRDLSPPVSEDALFVANPTDQ